MRTTVDQLEARARKAKLLRLEALALPSGATRDRLLRQARLEGLEVQEAARALRSRDEARQHFQRLFGPDLERAPLALRAALGGSHERGMTERWPGDAA